jgi:hypothetical protein
MSGFWCGIFCAIVLGILIFSASIAILLLISRNRRIVFDHHGITDTITQFGLIPWSEIQRLRVGPAPPFKVRCLTIDVDDPDKYRSRLPLLEKAHVSRSELGS